MEKLSISRFEKAPFLLNQNPDFSEKRLSYKIRTLTSAKSTLPTELESRPRRKTPFLLNQKAPVCFSIRFKTAIGAVFFLAIKKMQKDVRKKIKGTRGEDVTEMVANKKQYSAIRSIKLYRFSPITWNLFPQANCPFQGYFNYGIGDSKFQGCKAP